jgi:hypothetical protein
MAQIYSALAYYYDRQEEMDREIANQVRRIDALMERAGETPGRGRLRERRLL